MVPYVFPLETGYSFEEGKPFFSWDLLLETPNKLSIQLIDPDIGEQVTHSALGHAVDGGRMTDITLEGCSLCRVYCFKSTP